MSVISNSTLAGSSGQGGAAGYEIDRSLRFNSSDSPYLSRQASDSGSNVYKCTLSWWMKVGELGTDRTILNFGTNNTIDGWFKVNLETSSSNGDRMRLYGDTSGVGYLSARTTRFFRDPSAFYHCVISIDTTQSAFSDQIKWYVNGELLSEFEQNNPFPQNTPLLIGESTIHHVGAEPNSLGALRNYFDGYLADVHVIDGQALSATDFGKYDTNNVWQPKEFAGTYGTNGFHLDFSDTSSDAALGTDASGNGNTWTVNNLSHLPTTYTPPKCYQTDALYTNVADIVANGTLIGTNGIGGAAVTNKYCYIVHNGHGKIGQQCFSAGWDQYIYGYRYEANNTWTNTGGYNNTATSEWTTWAYSDDGTESSYDIDKNWGTGFTLLTGSGPAAYTGTYPTLDSNNFNSLDTIQANTDVFRDSPTNGDPTNDTGVGGELSGNYCTWNPLTIRNGGGTMQLVDGNLNFGDQGGASRYGCITGTMAVASGKWYFEVTYGSGNGVDSDTYVGILPIEQYQSNNSANAFNANSAALSLRNDAAYRGDNATTASYASGIAIGDTVGIAFDVDAGTSTWYLNGTSLGAFPYALASGYTWTPFANDWSNGQPVSSYIINCGQRPWVGTAPSSYKALCTANLPDPTIADGSTAFDTKLWTGNGGTTTVTGVEFEPSMLWIKGRSYAENHGIFDAVRGVGSSDAKRLIPNSTVQEYGVENAVNSFNSDGFTLGSNDSHNRSSETYVGWAWDAGSSTVTNTDGSISAQVRANPSAGFSIVSYTGTGSNATVGHGLNAAPEFIIVKNRDGAQNWQIYHSALGATKYFNFSTNGELTNSNRWQDTEPTSSVLSIGTSPGLNTLNNENIAYCFAPVKQYSSFGSFLGNGSADGPFVFTGFRPAFLLVKRTDSTGNWILVDQTRGEDKAVYPNSNISEASASFIWVDFVSNGFKIISSGGAVNASGGNYLYAAFAENPFKTSRAR